VDENQHRHDHDHDGEGRCQPHSPSRPIAEYQKHGIRFQFPGSWELTEESHPESTTITVQSEGTSFWTITLLSWTPDPDELLDQVVETFQQDYEDVDVLAQVGSICGLPTLGRDLDFVCYDLVNSAVLRSFQTSHKTILILFQGTDHELNSTRAELEFITASLSCEDEDEDEANFGDLNV
jgi:hypothetical protein